MPVLAILRQPGGREVSKTLTKRRSLVGAASSLLDSEAVGKKVSGCGAELVGERQLVLHFVGAAVAVGAANVLQGDFI
jgi:hypothetical protein